MKIDSYVIFLTEAIYFSLFMHYFVSHPDFSLSASSEIIRAVFSAIPELFFVFLLVKIDSNLEPALESIFTEVQCLHSSEGMFNILSYSL